MREADYDEFSKMLDNVASMLTRGTYKPSPTDAALWFRSLQRLDLRTVRAAFDAHVRNPARGHFMPTPADLLAQVEAMVDSGHPGVEEAWAMMPVAEDETVVWTAEMAEAFGTCQKLLAEGDRVGARMAFKEVYAKLLDLAKREGRVAVWQASLGTDLEKRKRVLAAAVESGRLSDDEAHRACPALPMPAGQRALLPAPNSERRDKYRQRMNALAEQKRNGDGVADPRAWAKQLRRREQLGEELSEAQRKAWRNALDTPMPETPMVFANVPREALPPGMRKGLR